MPFFPATTSIAYPCSEYHDMRKKWELIDDLCGGTLTMRDRRQKWLPQETRELPKDYEIRLSRTTLYNALKDTIEKISVKPFTKGIEVKGQDGLNETILTVINKNCDGVGGNLLAVARQGFKELVKRGIVHFLVDAPVIEGVSLSEQRDKKLYPYLSVVSATQVIAWEYQLINGRKELVEVRILEEIADKQESTFKKSVKHQVRVIKKDTWELWAVSNGQEDRKIKEGINPLGKIPLVTVYCDKVDEFIADPPFEDLAWQNLTHYQSSSDQRNILRVARVPILFASGFSEDDVKKGITVGAQGLVSSTNENAKLVFVEHQGYSIEAGEKDLAKLEMRMNILGLQPLLEQSGGVTATAKAMDEATSHSKAQTWAIDYAQGLTECFHLVAEYLGETLPKDFKIKLFTDFAISMKAGLDLQTLLAARDSGNLSTETLLNEYKRRGVLAEEVSVKDELERIKNDIPLSAKKVDKTGNSQNEPRTSPTKEVTDNTV